MQNNGAKADSLNKANEPAHRAMDPGVEALVQAIHASPMRAMLLFSGGASQVTYRSFLDSCPSVCSKSPML
jgi:hypothetical protein